MSQAVSLEGRSIRERELRVLSTRVLRRHDLAVGPMRSIPDADGGYRLAFGYRRQTGAGGLTQRYIEVRVSKDDYRQLSDDTVDRIVAELDRQATEVVQGQ